MELIEALRTTGAVRQYEDTPVPDRTVHRLLDTARFAPNGGNRQAWRVIVVKDPALRRAMRDVYLPGWYQYLAQASVGRYVVAVRLGANDHTSRSGDGASCRAESPAEGRAKDPARCT